MTLSPVFRSPAAVRLLEEEGVWERLAPALLSQADAVRTHHAQLRELLDSRFLASPPPLPEPGEEATPLGLAFLQEYFFLILFRSLFESLGVPRERLQLYAELNFGIKGTITAADNLFDDQSKSLLPLRPGSGARSASVLQLICFERLIRRTGDRAVEAGMMDDTERDGILRGLIDTMAEIGGLEGSEEGGVAEIPQPDEMVERVHRVRGGLLFTLGWVAPKLLERGAVGERVRRAEPAVARLGTAFQIVDDLTDFEFDLGRRSHNLLVSEIHHQGSPEQQRRLQELWAGAPAAPDLVEGLFRQPARAVLDRARGEARAAFATLEELGFWFPARLADGLVHAIAGREGIARVEALAATGAPDDAYQEHSAE
ncbi:hypothetical protein BH24GEM3_BH24GEM3_15120 [soil metagenome]